MITGTVRGWYVLAVGLFDTFAAISLLMRGESPSVAVVVLAVFLTVGGLAIVADPRPIREKRKISS